ncbi:MAG: indole-3-glycerol phosphate synthase TrpC [Bdellovibrionales bacterium]|nr:indole-3-glycerol phosphate synthase TrpC [Bdellovibrionales bacterium]
MTILDEIVIAKRKEVAQRRELYPVKLLEKSVYFNGRPVSLKHYLERSDLSGVIAEFKRASPSKGAINEFADVETVTIGYMQGGASALSVLTDEQFFRGSSKDLEIARKFNFCPILRKDFIVDEYQVVESKSIGADVILLIAAVLSSEEMTGLAKTAQQLGLEVLVEVHSKDELEKVPFESVDLVGVNNRDLNTFEVSIDTSIELMPFIPKEVVAISESGLESPDDVVKLKKAGFQGFLIGERFMKESRPHESCRRFIEQVRGQLGAS